MTEFYESTSRGKVRIDTMEHKWLVNSLAKLRREDPSRTEEIEAMRAQVDANEARFAAELADVVGVDRMIQATLDGDPNATPQNFDGMNDRIHLGANNPPEEIPFTPDAAADMGLGDANKPDVGAYWSPLAINVRNAEPLVALGKIKTTAAAIVTVATEAEAKTAGEAIVELRRVRQLGETAAVNEKAPILAASRVCDEFAKPFKALDAEQKRLERLTGGYQQKLVAERQKALADAAAAERAKADALLAEAAAQENKGADIVGDILLDHAQKGEAMADILAERAAGPVADLGRVVTETVSLGLRAPWTAEITDLEALRMSLGLLGAYLTLDAMLSAAKAYVRHNTSDGKFIGSQLPGVRIFQDVRGTARG
jgi:hypothetical protein